MPVRFNPSRNPATDKKWLLKDLLIETQKLDNKLCKLESSNLKDWSAVLNRFAELAKRQATNDTKKVTRSIWKEAKTVYSELSFNLKTQ
tara:strand:- start:5 stop:271 length:267 start_codon:yes stop_codon:yes gene_type:complete